MKTLFLTAAATALILSAPAAFAADDHHGGGHPDGGGGAPHTEHSAPAHTGHAAPTHTAPMRTTAPMTMSGPPHTEHAHHGMVTTTAAPSPDAFSKGHHDDHNRGHNNGHDNSHNANSHAIFGIGGHGKNRSHNNVHINFNRHNVTASHHYRYRGGHYRWPGGYHYQRWSFGMTLPSIFWGRDYWIDDYEDYGLGYPPPGCVWVRYGNDAILIDEDTGEILEVVYGQFY